ncbi:MAG: DUF3025 domain-containing protein [Polaromonas sp.]|nr:DUF3025 domain-containing protein [Polaromonas sp.]
MDWRQPWLLHLRDPGDQLAQTLRLCPDVFLHQALNSAHLTSMRFVPQAALPAGQAYEQFIFETGTVPTRDNLHDFFNGLCWIHFPETKKKLNELQAAEIARAGVSQLRGPVRDALTVFDENAAFLMAPQALWDALIEKDWHKLFIDLRPLWPQARLVLFGHALLEKLVHPRKAITAHVYLTQPATHSIAALDAWVAQDLSAGKLAGKPFAPLPVLGVPGWWPDNENFSFYDDSVVFRPRKIP